jgi:hypothetical protein
MQAKALDASTSLKGLLARAAGRSEWAGDGTAGQGGQGREGCGGRGAAGGRQVAARGVAGR